MTIGIYCILNKINDKRYIGKSINIEHRIWYHKNSLIKLFKPKDCNRHLYNAVQFYGINNFEIIILEKFDVVNEAALKDCELKWMDFYKTCDRGFGYNLRRDSSTGSIVHPETLAILSEIFKGENNPNFGNRWNDEQKKRMSDDVKRRRANGSYGDSYKKKIGAASSNTWKNEALKQQMAARVSKSKTLYDFHQFDLKGNLIKSYESIHEVLRENPEYKWQNIYAACNGNKPTYMGFLWLRKKKNSI